MNVILASASPRRRELLGKLFEKFEVHPAKGEEIRHSTCPEEVVLELACAKAAEVAEDIKKGGLLFSEMENILVIGADTVVAFHNQILGKPADAADAERTLLMLSGHTHQVYTGVALVYIRQGRCYRHSFYECTDVTFYEMSKEEIAYYVQTKEPMDKAGSYGIQGIGGRYVAHIQGDYDNVVGLPVARLYQELKTWRKKLSEGGEGNEPV